MVTISHIVKKLIESWPMLNEAIANNIVNYANLAEHIKKKVEMEYGGKVKEAAIVMALRRYGERAKNELKIPFKFNSEIIMKTGLSEMTLVRSMTILSKLRKIFDLVDYEKGETINIIQGNYEITLVMNDKHVNKAREILAGEKSINNERNLVSLTMMLSKDFLYTPGVLSKVTRKLEYENINVFENISTLTELIFIVSKKDAVKAYNALQELIES